LPLGAQRQTPAWQPTSFTASSPPALLGPWADLAPLWADSTPLMASSAPIVLPAFTVPGDETSSLMLPVTPEISHLPKAFAAAAQRVTELAPAIITVVDPRTGQAEVDDLPTPGPDQSWLLIDATDDDTPGLDGALGGVLSRIQWDSHP
jgi:hypothetical protein